MFAAYVFLVLAVLVALFQLALAFGAPWGEFTMGGRFPGKLPNSMRVAAIVQIAILGVFVLIVLSRSGLAFASMESFGRIGIWFVVAFFVFGTILNVSSESKKEKYVMGPANIIALISLLFVALG
jgi:hypothetical protein